jgi:hypothetical protein
LQDRTVVGDCETIVVGFGEVVVVVYGVADSSTGGVIVMVTVTSTVVRTDTGVEVLIVVQVC